MKTEIGVDKLDSKKISFERPQNWWVEARGRHGLKAG